MDPLPSPKFEYHLWMFPYYLLTLCEYKEARFLATIHMFAKDFFITSITQRVLIRCSYVEVG